MRTLLQLLFCFALMIFAAVHARAQDSYHFPRAVDRLDRQDIDNWPDPTESRQWVFNMWRHIENHCGAERRSVAQEMEFSLLLGSYVGAFNADFDFEANQEMVVPTGGASLMGLQDAVLLVRLRDCEDLSRIRESLRAIITEHGQYGPTEPARERFYALARDEVVTEAGLDVKEVARFRPDSPENWGYWRGLMEADVRANLPSDAEVPNISELDGEWEGTIQTASGERVPARLHVLRRASKYDEALLTIEEWDEENSHIPFILLSQDERLELQGTHSKSGRKLLVGYYRERPDEADQIEGVLYLHYLDAPETTIQLRRVTASVFEEFQAASKRYDAARVYAIVDEVVQKQQSGLALSEDERKVLEERSRRARYIGLDVRDKDGHEGALRHFRKALEWSAPDTQDWAYAHHLLGRSLHELRRSSEALPHLRAALDYYLRETPDSWEIPKLEERIAQIIGQ